MEPCWHVTEHNTDPIYTSDVVLYNGIHIPCISAPDRPTLNELLEAIGNYICTLSPVAGYGSDSITLDADLPCIKISEGDTLTEALVEIDTWICTIQSLISDFIPETIFNANTIIKADVDDTPVALTVAEQRLVGRVTGGVIDDLTPAQAISILETVDVDANSVFPYDGSKYFASGDGATTDKVIFVPLEDAVFANNPHLDWIHGVLGRGYEALSTAGKSTVKQSVASTASKEDSALISQSVGVGADTKDQTVYLADQTGAIGTLRYWYLRKDGADGRNFKLGYWNGATETERLEVSASTGMFNFNGTTSITGVLDEDTMVSDSAVHVPTQQSVKAYVDTNAASQTELDDTQTGAGLNADGTYTPDAGSTYLTASTSLYDADSILDAEIKEINDRSDETVEQTKKNVLCAMEVVGFADIATAGTYTISATSFPTGSVITHVRVYVSTAFEDDDGDTSTIGIYINAVGDIKAAAQLGAGYTAGIKADAWLDFDPTAPDILTAAGDKINIVVAMGGAATTLDAGEMKIYVEYF